ncbi:ribonuclease J [Trifolium pratense]|uniref:Ribonuclease J n=1 Tax=Trifolium pratense TaxID=57577 RepID=A0A2K3LUZ9_TRIPR|nr:ribonuclease J [Trifolium pratense]
MNVDDDIDIEGLLPEKDTTTSRAEGDLPDSEDSVEFWKQFIASSVEKSNKANNGYVSRKKYKSNVKKDDSEAIDEAKSEEMSNAEPESSKSVKKNKWKAEEVKKLIDLRSDLRDRFKVVKGRMALWEEISQSLLADGISRSPAQCKSLWTSLVLKYEDIKNGKDTRKNWQYLEDMEKILSSDEEPATN